MRGTILVVHDRGDLGAAEALAWGGFTIVTVADGREAMRLLDEQPPDLILLDLDAPAAGGFDSVRRLRERAGEVGLIVLTTHGTARLVREAAALGVREVLGKPFGPDRLWRVMAEQMDVQQRREGNV